MTTPIRFFEFAVLICDIGPELSDPPLSFAKTFTNRPLLSLDSCQLNLILLRAVPLRIPVLAMLLS